MKKKKLIKRNSCDYCFYPTLLDGVESYLNAENTWEQFYGHSEDPKITIDEYVETKKQDLINKINRVPYTSDAALKGTQFNNTIDFCVQEKLEDENHKMFIDEEMGTVSIADKVIKKDLDRNPIITLDNYYTFPLEDVKKFSNYYDEALCQQLCKGVVETTYGNVELYGYIDYLMPFKVCDLKTTKNYGGMGSFRHHWQHRVYPMCLRQMGCEVSTFEYNILRWGKDEVTPGDTFTEVYEFKPENDIPSIKEICEQLIRFLNANKDVITDVKVFNLMEEPDKKK